MTRPVLVLRPEPGNAYTAAAARARGLDAVALPLFTVSPTAWSAPDTSGYAGLLITSANALRFGGEALSACRHLPVYAVGRQTADAARAAGFTVQYEGAAGVGELAPYLPANGHLLHLCGADVTSFAAPIPVDQIIVYQSMAQVPKSLEEWLTKHPIALLHSVRAARHFASCVADRSRIAVAAFSPAVAAAAGTGWEGLAIAANPRDEDLFAALLQLPGTTRR